MHRVVLVCAFFIFAAPALSQGNSNAAVIELRKQLEAAGERADSSERAMLIRQAADELEHAQTTQAYARFEIVIGLFSVLITILVLFFGYRAAKLAGSEASAAAQREVASQKSVILALAEEARTASNAAREDAREARDLLASSRSEAEGLAGKARAASASAEASAIRASEEMEKVEKLRLGVEALARASERTRTELVDSPKREVELTPDEAAAVREGAAANPEKSAALMTADEFRLQIGKAAYLDFNHKEALRLAAMMEIYHGEEETAAAYALQQQGDALRLLGRFDRAIGIYSELIRRFEKSLHPAVAANVLTARYHRAVTLTDAYRFTESERELRAVLPLVEDAIGRMDSNTLTLRHELARTILEQGRFAEAEAEMRNVIEQRLDVNGPRHSYTLVARMGLARAIALQGRSAESVHEWRAILPLSEEVIGPNHSHTYVARYVFAEALLEAGQIDEAAEILAPVPDVPENSDWLERWSAYLAFVRAQLADARGAPEAAASSLVKAREYFTTASPPDYWARQRVEQYAARRSSGPTETQA